MIDGRIAAFEKDVLLPAYREIASSPALLRDFEAEVVTVRPHPNAAVEEVLAALAGALRRREGPSLVLTSRARPPGIATVGGYYVVTAFYEDAFVAPGVMFWMRFNNKLHAFAHRYDNAIARHDVGQVTRPHVLNHVLNSLTFYKLYAFGEKPFPGYR